MAAEFDSSDRLKAYTTMAEVSRKWCTVMDAKAGFVAALNAAILAFLWSSEKFGVEVCWPFWGAVASSACVVVSLWFAVQTVLPVESLVSALGRDVAYRDGYGPVSFYAFVVSKYRGQSGQFVRDVWAMTEEDLAREALEQHYTISHVAQKKSVRLTRAAQAWLIGVFFAVGAVALKRLSHGC